MPHYLIVDGDTVVGSDETPSPEEAVIRTDNGHLLQNDRSNLRIYTLETNEDGVPDPYLEEDLQL